MNHINRIPVEAYKEQAGQSPGLQTFNASSLAGEAVPCRAWHVEDLIPARTVTLLNGDGGTGKSLLALQLAVATCSDGYWAGRAPERGRVVYISAEDDKDELHRRLVDICADAQIRLEDLLGLDLVPLAGKDALLATPKGKTNVLQATDLFNSIDALIKDRMPCLVIMDTLADLFGGEENQRAQARQFIGMLRGLCLDHDTTVLLLAHPSLAGISSGSGSSGSTAWNNSVRSRLYLERLKGNDGTEDDPDLRVLTTKKANYGRTGDEIRLRWQNGVFRVATSGQDSFTAMAVEAKAERIFLSLLAAYEVEGRHVSVSTGHGFAPSLFAKDRRAEGVTKKAFETAMNRLFESGRIRNVEVGPPSRRTRKLEATEKAG